MSDKITNLTSANFKETISSAKTPVLVDFWAPWCPPCRAIGPTIEQCADELDGRVKVTKVNLEEDDKLAAEYGIRSIPTLLVFKDGKIVYQTVGTTDILNKKEEFKQKLLSFA